MSDDRLKDLPENVPERARTRTDATIAVGPAAGADGTLKSGSGPGSMQPLDSYQPAPMTTTTSPTSHSERIVPSTATLSSLLEQVRRTPAARLEIEARLASGGMGTIDVAVDRALDRRIAIKTLHSHLRTDDSAVRMFLREARLTGLLDHPHIVPVYDLGERPHDGSLFFAMKLVEGRTLAALIRSLPRGMLDTATIYGLLDVITKVCDALAFAHSRGVIHCDVKPANVMIGDFGQVYLMDWGIARLAPGEPRTDDRPEAEEVKDVARPPRHGITDRSIIGTPAYMSPEQARGDRRRLDARSDVFLLGATLYEVLTHRPPYTSSDRAETLALAAACAFPSPRKVAGGAAVPPELDRIVMRAMAKAPEDRYPTIAELREDLVRFMRGGAEFPRRSFEAGAVIVREGEPGDAAYIVVDGRCEILKDTPNGPRTLHHLGPGDVFGEMAILTDGPRTATVVATSPTTVLVVTSQVLEQEMAALKPWIARLLTSLAGRFRVADTEHRTSSAAGPSPARIANQILMNVLTWGADDGHGGRYIRWSVLAPELHTGLDVAPPAIFGAVSHYELVLDIEADRLTIPNADALRERLRVDLAADAAG